MMASSTTMPMASDRASRVKVLMVKPRDFKITKLPISDVGMAMITFKADVHEPRKR